MILQDTHEDDYLIRIIYCMEFKVCGCLHLTIENNENINR